MLNQSDKKILKNCERSRDEENYVMIFGSKSKTRAVSAAVGLSENVADALRQMTPSCQYSCQEGFLYRREE